MLTVVLAWLAVLALCAAAVLFGQTARGGRRRGASSARLGVLVSRSGPLLAVLGAAAVGTVTGTWLLAAAIGACGVVVAATVGLLLAPR